jgi:PIN domain nuclease of toxin-antitoxin system
MILLDTHPGDQLIIATARSRGIPLMTSDAQILAYPHVELVRQQV